MHNIEEPKMSISCKRDKIYLFQLLLSVCLTQRIQNKKYVQADFSIPKLLHEQSNRNSIWIHSSRNFLPNKERGVRQSRSTFWVVVGSSLFFCGLLVKIGCKPIYIGRRGLSEIENKASCKLSRPLLDQQERPHATPGSKHKYKESELGSGACNLSISAARRRRKHENSSSILSRGENCFEISNGVHLCFQS